MKTKKIISVILCITLLLTTIFCLSGVKEYDEKLLTAEKIAKKLFVADDGDENELVYSYNLKGLDEEEDYILVKGRTKGYAIFTKEDLQLIEYSPESKSPYEDYDMSKSYYAGPINHMVKRGTSFMNIYSNERISANNAVTLATNVKSDIKDMKPQKDVQIKDLQTSSITKTVSTEQANEKSGIVEKIEYYDPDKYADNWALVSRNYINDYSYFLSDPKFKPNNGYSCTVVAAQLLMSYNNWSKYGLLITEPSFIMNGPGSGVDRDKPYLEENISTTDAFHEYLYGYILGSSTNGASVDDVAYGISKYMSTYKPDVIYNLDYTFDANQTKSMINSEISNNRPCLGSVWYHKEQNEEIVEEGRHMVVVYGRQVFATPNGFIDGYIIHSGWENVHEGYHLWIDSRWFVKSLSFELYHTHDFANYANENHVKKCSTCDVRITTNNHDFQDVFWKYVNDYDNSESDVLPKDLDPKYHWVKCSCGMVKEEEHLYIYKKKNNSEHYIGCMNCLNFDYENLDVARYNLGVESHYNKYSDHCLNCGG